MKKKIFVTFVLLAVGCYGLTLFTPKAQAEPLPTANPSQTATVTNAPRVCKVTTGLDGGTVNLRRCAGTGCDVLKIVNEGESLDIITAGAWLHVITKAGATGFIKSNYCEVKP